MLERVQRDAFLQIGFTEDPNTTVCLVETGPEDSSPLIHVPALYAFLVQVEGESKYSYGYDTVPQKEFSSVTLKGSANITDTLGGTYQIPKTSRKKEEDINPEEKLLEAQVQCGMLYVRGHKWDYDHWAELGNEGWSYDDVLPYFKKSEDNELLDNEYHGKGGPLTVSQLRHDNPFSRYFVEAASKHYKKNDDFNGEDQEELDSIR